MCELFSILIDYYSVMVCHSVSLSLCLCAYLFPSLYITHADLGLRRERFALILMCIAASSHLLR